MFDNSKLLVSLTNNERAQLEIFCQRREIKEGEILFKEGEEANAMYLLQEGEIEISKNIYGNKAILGNLKSEDILGEMALFGETGKRMATAKIIKDSVLITILSFSIKELTEKQPNILKKIKEIIEIRNLENKAKL